MAPSRQILLINDSRNEARYISNLLIREGFNVYAATSGKSGLRILQQKPVALVLVDMILPDIEGDELLKKIKNNPETAEVPVIYFTARNDPDIIIKTLAAGAVDFINKATPPEELLLRIKLQIDLSSKHSDLKSQLRHSEKRFKVMLDHTHDAEFFRNAGGELEYVSPGLEKLFGYSTKDYLAGKYSFRDIIHPEDLEETQKNFLRAMNGEVIDGYIARFKHQNGTIIYGAISSQPVYNEHNEFIGIRTSLRDINRQVQLSQQLEESEAQYRALFESNPVVILIIDPDTDAIYDANPAACNFYGYTKEQLRKIPITQINAASKDEVKKHIKTALSNPDTQFNFVHQLADGTKRNVEVYSSPFQIDNKTYLYSIIQDTTEKIKAEKSLKQYVKKLENAQEKITTERDRIKAIFNNVMDAIITIDEKGIIIMYNQSAQNIFGYTKQEAVGENIKIIMPPEYANKHDHYLENYLKTGKKKIIGKPRKVTAQKKDGTQFPAEIRIQEAKIGDNRRFVGIIRDISEREEQEKTLKEREEKYRALFNNSNDAIYLFGLDENGKTTNFVDVNKVAEKMLGYTRDEFLQMNPRDINSPNNPKLKRKVLRELLTKGKTLVTLYHQTKDKRDIPVEIHAHRFNLKGKELILSIARDIREREKARKKLESSNERFRKLSEMSTQGILIHSNNIILDCNKKLCEILGTERTALLNQNYLNYLTKPAGKKVEKFTDRNISAPFEIEVICAKGHIKNIEAISRKIEWAGYDARVLTFNDITERKKFENELIQAKQDAEEANRARESFLANMSHEIRTPLNAIIGFSDMVNKQITDPKIANPLNVIHESGAKLKDMVNCIIDTAKMQSGNIDIVYEPTNIKNLIKELLDHQTVPSHKNIEKSFKADEHFEEKIYIDPVKLRQILKAILDNAVKFTHKGIIELSLACENHHTHYCDLVIRVKDSGVGIKKDFISHVFEYFSQQEQSDTRKYGGTGIGLAISKQLTELMNGKIFAESTENIGTTITLYFPQMKIEKSEEIIDPNVITHQFNKTVNLLQLSHAANITERINMQLTASGINIYETSIPGEFVQYLKMHSVDIIMIDTDIALEHYTDIKSFVNDATQKPLLIGIQKQTSESADSVSEKFDFIISQNTSLASLMEFITKRIHNIKQVSASNETIPKAEQDVDIDHLKKLLPVLEGNLMELWKQLNQRVSIKTVDLFIKSMEEQLQHYPVSSLKEFVKNLKQQREAFDVAEISNTLNEYPGLISHYKKIINHRYTNK